MAPVLPWLKGIADPAMNTKHCQNCIHWDQANGLENTNLGAVAPCTCHAPRHFSLEAVEISGAALAFSGYGNNHSISEMELPMGLWPYTTRNQSCGSYQPCDLEESARRTRMRAAPLI